MEIIGHTAEAGPICPNSIAGDIACTLNSPVIDVIESIGQGGVRSDEIYLKLIGHELDRRKVEGPYKGLSVDEVVKSIVSKCIEEIRRHPLLSDVLVRLMEYKWVLGVKGSRATGRATPGSDFDFYAVRREREHYLPEEAMQLLIDHLQVLWDEGFSYVIHYMSKADGSQWVDSRHLEGHVPVVLSVKDKEGKNVFSFSFEVEEDGSYYKVRVNTGLKGVDPHLPEGMFNCVRLCLKKGEVSADKDRSVLQPWKDRCLVTARGVALFATGVPPSSRPELPFSCRHWILRTLAKCPMAAVFIGKSAGINDRSYPLPLLVPTPELIAKLNRLTFPQTLHPLSARLFTPISPASNGRTPEIFFSRRKLSPRFWKEYLPIGTLVSFKYLLEKLISSKTVGEADKESVKGVIVFIVENYIDNPLVPTELAEFATVLNSYLHDQSSLTPYKISILLDSLEKVLDVYNTSGKTYHELIFTGFVDLQPAIAAVLDGQTPIFAPGINFIQLRAVLLVSYVAAYFSISAFFSETWIDFYAQITRELFGYEAAAWIYAVDWELLRFVLPLVLGGVGLGKLFEITIQHLTSLLRSTAAVTDIAEYSEVGDFVPTAPNSIYRIGSE